MKIIKGIGVFFLSLFAFLFILILSLSFIFKNVIQKDVVGSVVKNIIVEEFSEDKELTKQDKENIKKINDVIKTDDINKLVDKLLDEYEKSLENDNYEVSDKTVDYIVDLLVEYKDLINDITNEKVTEKQIRSKETRDGIKEGINEVLTDHPEDIEDTVRITITSYNLFVSTTFRLILILLTIICFALIALIRKSYIKWMKSASSIFIFTGILVSSLYFGLLYAFRNINTSSKYSITIDPKYILVLGIVEIIIGIAFLITHIILTKKDE